MTHFDKLLLVAEVTAKNASAAVRPHRMLASEHLSKNQTAKITLHSMDDGFFDVSISFVKADRYTE